MLPKTAYSKVLQGLRRIKEQWDQDRAENPSTVPYEIDFELRALIERTIREERVNCHGRRDTEILVDSTIRYLVDKGFLAKSPYGGTFFPLPKDHAPLPTQEALIRQTKAKIDAAFFGKKPND